MTARPLPVLLLVIVAQLSGCETQRAVSDPLEALGTPSLSAKQHSQAMEALDMNPSDDAATIEALKDVVSSEAYSIEIREQALVRLDQRDHKTLMTAIRRTLPMSKNPAWIERVSQIIAERGWTELSPALVSSWARPVLQPNNDLQRPEYLALAKLHGADNVPDVVFQMFVEARSVGEQGLRTRCWDLLHRLGQRPRLVEMLSASEVPNDDAMLLDLKAAANDLGIVPHNREEILWLRKLRDQESGEFWSRAAEAVAQMSQERRSDLELRDLPIIVSASLYDPALLRTPTGTLYDRISARLSDQKHYVQESNYDGYAGESRQRLHEYKDKLSWGDLAAILMAIRATQVPEVAAHLFNFAERDRTDKSTEYGGVISLDARDRFEVRQFVPLIRRHDQRFEAPQQMLDAAYTAIFHFHLHAQSHRNATYAGPGYGDMNYADNTRANCLVFTFLNENTMNVDFYRHDRVVVDLGEIKRPPPAPVKNRTKKKFGANDPAEPETQIDVLAIDP